MTLETAPQLNLVMFEALNAAGKARTLQEFNEALGATLRSAGLSSFSVVEACVTPELRFLTLLFGIAPTAWCETHACGHWAPGSPSLHHMLSSVEPTFLSELTTPHLAPPARDVLLRLRSQGHADGFIWPMHLPQGRVRAVLLVSDVHDLDGGIRVVAAALAAGLYAAGAKLLRLEADADHRVALRPRQLECLRWARQGKSSTVTGLILGISGRTVDEHIAHACDALGVRTRIQAVARAVMLGLI